MPEDTKEQMTKRAQLVRVFEAACEIDHPSDDERNFRIACMKALGSEFGLREMRNVTIAGPGNPKPR